MLHLIESLLPAPIHRALLPFAHRARHTWRKFRKAPISGVSAILTNDTGEVLLLRHSYGPQGWALPGGGLAREEVPEDCARREVFEELGLTITAIEPVGQIEEILSGSPHTAHVFTAKINARPKPDGREVIEARFFPPDSLPEPLGETTRRRIAMWKDRGKRV